METSKKPETFPSAVEPDEQEEEPKSTLPEPVVDREAKRAIQEIEDEIEEEHPSKPTPPPPARHGPEPSLLDKAWDAQYKLENRLKRVGHGRYGRVIKMARKPDPEEFHKAAQITGIGILFVGMVGFVIFLLMHWLELLLHIK